MAELLNKEHSTIITNWISREVTRVIYSKTPGLYQVPNWSYGPKTKQVLKYSKLARFILHFLCFLRFFTFFTFLYFLVFCVFTLFCFFVLIAGAQVFLFLYFLCFLRFLRFFLFGNCCGRSRSTCMQNLGLLAQKLSELCSI